MITYLQHTDPVLRKYLPIYQCHVAYTLISSLHSQQMDICPGRPFYH